MCHQVAQSPYGQYAYCEIFPRGWENATSSVTLQYWAQVGKPTTLMPNYDNIYQAMLSTFIMITADNWDANMKNIMVLTNDPWLPSFFTVITMIIGIYTVLNLFLAILLSNLDELVDVPDPSVAASRTSLSVGLLERISSFVSRHSRAGHVEKRDRGKSDAALEVGYKAHDSIVQPTDEAGYARWALDPNSAFGPSNKGVGKQGPVAEGGFVAEEGGQWAESRTDRMLEDPQKVICRKPSQSPSR